MKQVQIKTQTEGECYGIAIIAINSGNTNYPINISINPTVNKSLNGISVVAQNSTTILITLPTEKTHSIIILGGAIAKYGSVTTITS